MCTAKLINSQSVVPWTISQAHLWGGIDKLIRDGLPSTNAHSTWLQQRKGQCTSRVYYISHCSCGTAGQQRDSRKQLPPYPYLQWSQKLGGKSGLLNLPNTITILLLLLLLMTLIDGWDVWIAITRCIWVKNPDIKKAPWHYPQNPLAWISAWASSCQFAFAGTIVSPVSCCRGDSLATS